MSTLPALRTWGPWLALALLSAMLRLGFASHVDAWSTPPAFDEIGYAARAQGALAGMLGDLEGWRALVGRSRWPPLHPLLLAPGALAGTAGMRVVSVLIGVLGSLSLAVLGRTVVDARAGWVAGGLHAALPVWLAYGSWLWSEGTFVVVGAWTLALAWRCLETSSPRMALLTGLLLGASLLTRATALPWLLAIPWVLWRYGSRELAGRCLLGALCCWGPWVLLSSWERGALVPGSALGGYNAWLGALEGAPTDNGGAWGLPEHKALAHAAMKAASPGSLALQAWLDAPLEQLRRTVWRAAILLTPDYFLARHALSARWAGLSMQAASAWAAVSLVTAWALPLLGCAGLTRVQGRRRVWCLLALLPLLPALLTVATPRLALPSWTWLAALCWTATGSHRRAGLALALVVAGTLLALPRTLERHLSPVHSALPALRSWLPLAPVARDRVKLRRSTVLDEPVELSAPSLRVPGTRPSSALIWPAEQPEVLVEIIGTKEPATLWIGGRPFEPAAGPRGRWQPTPLPAIEARWPEQ